MLKAEFIKELKQTNVSESMEKTMERLRATWSPLATPEREEILTLAGLKKPSIERAYKTGNVSAKILAAVSQVLSVDPYYLAGKTDEQRPFDDALLIQFLNDVGYEVGKNDVVKSRKPKTQAAVPTDAIPLETPTQHLDDDDSTEANPTDKTETADTQELSPVLRSSPDQIDLSVVANEIVKLDKDSLGKLNELTEDDLILMLKSLTVQAGFSEGKKNRLALVKYLLLT